MVTYLPMDVYACASQVTRCQCFSQCLHQQEPIIQGNNVQPVLTDVVKPFNQTEIPGMPGMTSALSAVASISSFMDYAYHEHLST